MIKACVRISDIYMYIQPGQLRTHGYIRTSSQPHLPVVRDSPGGSVGGLHATQCTVWIAVIEVYV